MGNISIKHEGLESFPLHVEGVTIDTKESQCIITLPKGTGKYKVDIINLLA